MEINTTKSITNPINNLHKSGIYLIRNTTNNKIYIGESVDIAKRCGQHLCDLKHSRHPNDHLQKSFHKYGDVFEFCVLELVEESQLLKRENYWINHYDSSNKEKGYNNLIPGDDGKKRTSDETKRKLSFARMGRFCGIDNHFYGKKHSDYTKKLISESRKGKPLSEEHRLKVIAKLKRGEDSHFYGIRKFGKDNPNFGKTSSKKSRDKMSISQTGGRIIIIQRPDGKLEDVINFQGFCRDNFLDYGAMKCVKMGTYNQHKGFKVIKTILVDGTEIFPNGDKR